MTDDEKAEINRSLTAMLDLVIALDDRVAALEGKQGIPGDFRKVLAQMQAEKSKKR